MDSLMGVVIVIGIIFLFVTVPVWLCLHSALKCIQLMMRGQDCRKEEWTAALSFSFFISVVVLLILRSSSM